MPELIETSYIGVRFFAGKRSRSFVPLATLAEAHDWAQRAVALDATVAPPRFFSWQEQVPPDFDGLAVEEIRWRLDLTGQRARVWHRPTADSGAPVMAQGKPLESRPPRVTRTHYELRAIIHGRPTQLRAREDTLKQARLAAERQCRALGFENFFELDTGENFADATADGVYLLEVKTEYVAKPL
jgi:hypothetical protein